MVVTRVVLALTPSLAALPLASNAAAAAAPGGGRQVTMQVPAAPGPAALNRIFLREYGPKKARTVLVLTPGSPGGQGDYAALAPALVARVPGLAVWAVDRRANALEDVSAFRDGTPDDALGYYILGQPFHGKTFAPVGDEGAPYVREWGAAVALNDLHTVVEAARAGGRRRVVLGGHSAGGVTVPAYAAWDFAGRAGYRDLAGMLQIDGAEFGAFSRYLVGTPYATPWRTVAQATEGLAAAAKVSPYGIAGSALPVPLWAAGVLPELACAYARSAPNAPSVLQSAVPADLRSLAGLPTVTVTNEAFFGMLVTSKDPQFSAAKVRVGHLASSGSPRPWVNGPYSTVTRACAAYAQEPGNGLEWYYPARLDHDLIQGLTTLEPTPASAMLGLRARHLHHVDTPLFAFQTGLSEGGVLRGTRAFISRSKVTDATLVSDPAMGHFDPLLDTPSHNSFIKAVVPWLKRIAR